MFSKMGTTDSRSAGGPGDGQERRGERPGSHPAAEPSRCEKGGAKDDQSRLGQERVLAGQSDGSPVDAERPTRSEGHIPDVARPFAGEHKGDQEMADMKSVGTQTYEDDKTRAHADLPEQSATEGTTGAGFVELGVSASRQRATCPLRSQCNLPVQDTCPHAMPLGIDTTTTQAGAGFATDHSPVFPTGNPPAQVAVCELQQTQRKEAHIAAGSNIRSGNIGEDRHGSTVGNTGFRTETEMEPNVKADDTQTELVRSEAGRIGLSVGPKQGEDPGADDTQVSGRRPGDEPRTDKGQGVVTVERSGERPGRRQVYDRRQAGEPVADNRQGQASGGRQREEARVNDRLGQFPAARHRREPGADNRQGQVPVGMRGGEPGAHDRQGMVPIERHGSEQGTDRRQGQVPVETLRDTNTETRPPERGEGGRTSVETQTEKYNAERCTASVKLLLDQSGDDAETTEHKEHIIHEMSQGSRQVLKYKTAHGLALHVLKQQTWKVDKIWCSHNADSNMSEVGVHNVLKELEQHNKRIGHIVEYFTLEHSKRLDIIQLIQKIHAKCDFCETIYNSIYDIT